MDVGLSNEFNTKFEFLQRLELIGLIPRAASSFLGFVSSVVMSSEREGLEMVRRRYQGREVFERLSES